MRVSPPARFSGTGALPFLAYSALGTALWTAALAYAAVLLEANFRLVGDYLNVATLVVLAFAGVLLVRRYVNCWNAERDERHPPG